MFITHITNVVYGDEAFDSKPKCPTNSGKRGDSGLSVSITCHQILSKKQLLKACRRQAWQGSTIPPSGVKCIPI